MKRCPSSPAFLLALGLALLIAPARAQPPAVADRAALERAFAPMELMFCFMGKGSCLPYDAGVLHEAHARIPALRDGRVIVAGNSSGGIPAAYFCCHGFTDATIRHAEERLETGDRSAVRTMENVNTKIAKLSRGQSTEIEHANLKEYVAFALGVESWRDARDIGEIVRRSSARPRHPCLIVACNLEVLEDRNPEDSMSPGRLKEFDYGSMQASWKPAVHRWYRDHPERFRRDHPHLVLGSDRRIGSGVTFFVDQSMYDLLSQIPDDERIADLRLMTDASDVALAILASASEPTYFPPVVDPHPERILPAGRRGSIGETVRRRSYLGGYIVSMPGQEVRRMLPGIRILGTGWRHNPLVARSLLANWLLADCEEVALRSEWWADMEINPDEEFQSHIEVRDLTNRQEMEFGRRRAAQIFDQGGGLPTFVQPPRFRSPAPAAIHPDTPRDDMFTGERTADGQPVLATMRGLGPLLAPPAGDR